MGRLSKGQIRLKTLQGKLKKLLEN